MHRQLQPGRVFRGPSRPTHPADRIRLHSNNIRVISIIRWFLEHSRVFYFENGGDAVVYCASADWMQRNLFQRVETCFPILDQGLRERVIRQGLLSYLEDNVQAWELQFNGEYHRLSPSAGDPARSAQERMLSELSEKAPVTSVEAPLPKRLNKSKRRKTSRLIPGGSDISLKTRRGARRRLVFSPEENGS